jgi:hypothetical protein
MRLKMKKPAKSSCCSGFRVLLRLVNIWQESPEVARRGLSRPLVPRGQPDPSPPLHYPSDHARLTSGWFCFTVRFSEQVRPLPDKTKPRASRGSLVARRGFEPRQTEPKSVVLPLYYRAILSFPPVRPFGLPTLPSKRSAKIRVERPPSKRTLRLAKPSSPHTTAPARTPDGAPQINLNNNAAIA